VTKSLTYIEIDIPTWEETSPQSLTTWRFAIPTNYLPSDIDAIPSIDDVNFTPATISLGENLGTRASLTVQLRDHRHIFATEPYNQGTFFGKWRGRYGTKLRGYPLRLIRGALGQALADMETRHYLIESTDGPTLNGVYTIEAKDILKFADDDRSQAPALSNGELAGNITDAATSAILSPTGIGDIEYPASGYLCIGGKEVVTFTRSGDTLTIVRGQDGSDAIAHEAGERMQLCLRYDGDDAADIIYDLLTNYAAVDAGYITLSEWQAETASFLGVIYARTITEPTSVNKLISEFIEQAALAIWWDDLARKIRLRVLREISTDTDIFTQERIIADSLSVKEQPGKRISQIWTYYGERDPTDRGAEADNFRAALASVDLERETAYGSAEIVKIQAKWIETVTAAERLNGIQLSRFRDPPRAFRFALFGSERVNLGDGYQIYWWGNQNQLGVEQPALIQITQVATFPDRIEIQAEEMLASGVVTVTNTIFLLTAGSLESFTVPDSWNNSDNTIYCVGGGGSGRPEGTSGGGSGGGGGGACSYSVNVTLPATSPASDVMYQVGIGGYASGIDGGDTWFNGATFAAATIAAEGGKSGSGSLTGGAGGQASAGIGDTRTSGGDGGDGTFRDSNSRATGGGGGGAGGPNGDGGDGGDGGDVNNALGGGGGGADGGEDGSLRLGGHNRFNFGGGKTESSPNGQQGGGGLGNSYFTGISGIGGVGEQIWTQTIAPIISAGPGGGGGGGARLNPGREGGLYGGGGGGKGAASNPGNGQQGIIVLTWRAA
jgi:hypothetical protein